MNITLKKLDWTLYLINFFWSLSHIKGRFAKFILFLPIKILFFSELALFFIDIVSFEVVVISNSSLDFSVLSSIEDFPIRSLKIFVTFLDSPCLFFVVLVYDLSSFSLRYLLYTYNFHHFYPLFLFLFLYKIVFHLIYHSHFLFIFVHFYIHYHFFHFYYLLFLFLCLNFLFLFFYLNIILFLLGHLLRYKIIHSYLLWFFHLQFLF